MRCDLCLVQRPDVRTFGAFSGELRLPRKANSATVKERLIAYVRMFRAANKPVHPSQIAKDIAWTEQVLNEGPQLCAACQAAVPWDVICR